MKRDSLGNTTLQGDFSHPILLVFPDSKIRYNNEDNSSTRPCPCEEVDYVAGYVLASWEVMGISVCPLACNLGVPIIIVEMYMNNRYI